MSAVEATVLTPDDLLTMPDGERYELVDGQLLEKTMGAEADWIGMRIIHRLMSFVMDHRLGEIFGPETGFQCFRDNPSKVRKPDGSFLVKGRLPGGAIPKGHIRIAPDLAIEVVSPNDRYYHVDAKVHEYLEAGVRLVWVINPDLRMVKVYAAEDEPSIELWDGDNLSGGDVLPGFQCAVSELFPEEGMSARNQ